MNEKQRTKRAQRELAMTLAETAHTPDDYERAHLAMRQAFPMLAADYACQCDTCTCSERA